MQDSLSVPLEGGPRHGVPNWVRTEPLEHQFGPRGGSLFREDVAYSGWEVQLVLQLPEWERRHIRLSLDNDIWSVSSVQCPASG